MLNKSALSAEVLVRRVVRTYRERCPFPQWVRSGSGSGSRRRRR
ncbi:hypothetical protein BOH78_2602 [Pichia kudriavzevii]|uniref:Uncharacterized protein n=1 Tax=Pichia kudriavzevii TaxID=4909 RepID=A0A1V2LME3_PICKU|nr:hypothetical protein BOH78_2602 [Pichia kudriavzevii]